jgi:sugar O-acyltransferase (sialic acid O-acetyltransferase NeuD family)
MKSTMRSTNRGVYLIGCGGHGRVVLDALLASGTAVAGIVDAALPVGQSVFGIEVLGADDWLSQRQSDDVLLLNGVGANPHTTRRRELFVNWQARGYEFGIVLHPSAVVGRECEIASGAQIMAGTVLQNRVRIGYNAVINTRAAVDHDVEICSHAFVGPGVVLTGGVVVESGAFVGAAAVVLPGIRIGEDAIVGAGAVVIENVPRGCTVVGTPAARMGTGK